MYPVFPLPTHQRVFHSYEPTQPGPHFDATHPRPQMGKTTLFMRHFGPPGYEHVKQDALKTKAKCLGAVEAALKAGRSVVAGALFPHTQRLVRDRTRETADNTNRNRKTHGDYLDLTEKIPTKELNRLNRTHPVNPLTKPHLFDRRKYTKQ